MWERSDTSIRSLEGFCYAAIDSNFPSYIKIGCTKDISSRHQDEPNMDIFFCCGDVITARPKRDDGEFGRYSEGRLEQLVLGFFVDIGLSAFPEYVLARHLGEADIGHPKGASEYVKVDRAAILRHAEDTNPEIRAFLLNMLEAWDHKQLEPDNSDSSVITVDELEASYDEDCRPAARIHVPFEEPSVYREDED